ncbi:MAG TPA: sigma factor [Gemmataceae bacterium]|nr:sigma factor [Gemmataceae bacterium]
MYKFALTKDEERVLAPKARRHVRREKGEGVNPNDHTAAERLVKSAAGMIAKFAHKWADKTGFPFDDLFQEGMLAATRCLSKFEPEQGYKFCTYASTSAWRERYVELKSKFAKEYAVSPNHPLHGTPQTLDSMTPQEDPAPREDVEPFLKVLTGTTFDFPVRAYYGIGMAAMNQREIGRKLGLSGSCIANRLTQSIEAIRRALVREYERWGGKCRGTNPSLNWPTRESRST